MAYGPNVEKHDKTAVKDYFWHTKSVEASNQSDCDTLFGASLNRCEIDAKSLRSEMGENPSLEPGGGGGGGGGRGGGGGSPAGAPGGGRR